MKIYLFRLTWVIGQAGIWQVSIVSDNIKHITYVGHIIHKHIHWPPCNHCNSEGSEKYNIPIQYNSKSDNQKSFRGSLLLLCATLSLFSAPSQCPRYPGLPGVIFSRYSFNIMIMIFVIMIMIFIFIVVMYNSSPPHTDSGYVSSSMYVNTHVC